MQLQETSLHGVLVVAPGPGRLDAAVAGDFRDELSRRIGPGSPKVVLDMDGVEFMDSSGLTALISTVKSLGGRGGEIVVASLGPSLQDLFQLTRLDKVFRVFPDAEAASRALADSAP